MCKPLLLTARIPLFWVTSPLPVQSDFGEGEFTHAAQILHGDLEGVFVGVVSDDVVVHVD